MPKCKIVRAQRNEGVKLTRRPGIVLTPRKEVSEVQRDDDFVMSWKAGDTKEGAKEAKLKKAKKVAYDAKRTKQYKAKQKALVAEAKEVLKKHEETAANLEREKDKHEKTKKELKVARLQNLKLKMDE